VAAEPANLLTAWSEGQIRGWVAVRSLIEQQTSFTQRCLDEPLRNSWFPWLLSLQHFHLLNFCSCTCVPSSKYLDSSKHQSQCVNAKFPTHNSPSTEDTIKTRTVSYFVCVVVWKEVSVPLLRAREVACFLQLFRSADASSKTYLGHASACGWLLHWRHLSPRFSSKHGHFLRGTVPGR